MRKALQQFAFLFADAKFAVAGCRWRWYSVWFSPQFLAIVPYRLQRAAYLAFGRGFQSARVLLAPVRMLLRPFFGAAVDIDYRAEIGPGLHISHPELGVIVTPFCIVGRNLFLFGGNVIGRRKRHGEMVLIGDNVTMGIKSSILGEIVIASDATIGAYALAIKSVPDGKTLIENDIGVFADLLGPLPTLPNDGDGRE